MLATYADKQNIKTLIASSDKDLMQLVSANVSQLDMKGTFYDHQGVIKKMLNQTIRQR
jgi:DNA polymerase-1